MPETPITEVTDATFETEVLESNQPVIADFWADWCGPCRAVSKMVEQLAESYVDQLRVVRIDVDSNPQTPSYYGIKSIPTFLKFADGELVDRLVGAVPHPTLEQMFEE